MFYLALVLLRPGGRGGLGRARERVEDPLHGVVVVRDYALVTADERALAGEMHTLLRRTGG